MKIKIKDLFKDLINMIKHKFSKKEYCSQKAHFKYSTEIGEKSFESFSVNVEDKRKNTNKFTKSKKVKTIYNPKFDLSFDVRKGDFVKALVTINLKSPSELEMIETKFVFCLEVCDLFLESKDSISFNLNNETIEEILFHCETLNDDKRYFRSLERSLRNENRLDLKSFLMLEKQDLDFEYHSSRACEIIAEEELIMPW